MTLAAVAVACDHARKRLGALIGGNNERHAARAVRAGNFTLGAQR